MRSCTMIALALAVTFGGCGGKKDKEQPAVGGAPATPPVDDKPIDVCSWVPKDQIEAVLGKLSKEPQTLKKMGAQLGGCTWETGEMTIATVTPRPAGEFDGTVKASGDPTDVPGVGEKAVNTSKAGMLVKVAGKPYFLHVMVIKGAQGMNAEKATELAKLIVPAAK
jgi:hypothetical protein